MMLQISVRRWKAAQDLLICIIVCFVAIKHPILLQENLTEGGKDTRSNGVFPAAQSSPPDEDDYLKMEHEVTTLSSCQSEV